MSCLGRCDIAPAVAVNERPAPVAEVDALVTRCAGSGVGTAAAAPDRTEPWPNDPYPAGSRSRSATQSLRALLAGTLTPTTSSRRCPDSGLRGMGGAGFPTGKKWELVAAPTRGHTVRDLQRRRVRARHVQGPPDPRRPAAPRARGPAAGHGRRRRRGGLGLHPARVRPRGARPSRGDRRAARGRDRRAGRAAAAGAGWTLDVFVSPGGYILGEETALLECMEGHRGEPRNKPPFPGIYGLHGRPTLINSVETFADVPVIVATRRAVVARPGPRRLDRAGSSSRCPDTSSRPGVYCVPMGTTVRESDRPRRRGGRAARPSARCSRAARRPTSSAPTSSTCDWTSTRSPRRAPMLGSGALVVLAEGTDLLAASTNVLRFFRNESCGKCVPCRVGSTKAHALLRSDARRRTSSSGRRAAGADPASSRRPCARRRSAGSGQVALGPVVSVLGLDKGGAAARDHPKPGGASDQPDRESPAAARPAGDRSTGGREFFTTRTVAEALRGFRPARRTAVRGRPARPTRCTGCRPPTCGRRRPCPASPGPPSTVTPCGPPTRTARPKGCRPTWTSSGAVRMGPQPSSRSGRARRWRCPPAACCPTAPTPSSWSSTPPRRCRAPSR